MKAPKFIRYRVKFIQDYVRTHKKLHEVIKAKDAELIEFFKKAREREEEFAMLKDAHRLKQQELVAILESRFQAEERARAAEAELGLIKQGVKANGRDIKAISLVKTGEASETEKETYSPLILTLNETGTEIIKRELGAESIRDIALNSAKIAFIELFDKDPMGMN